MKYNRKHLILTILFPIFIGIVQLLSHKPEWIELYYSNGIYPYISKILRTLFGWLPFSFGDTLGILVIILFIKGVFRLFKDKFKNFIPKLLHVTAFLSAIYSLFYLFWGLNYFRKPLAEKLHLQQSTYTTEELINTTEKIINRLNEIHFSITNNDSIVVEISDSKTEIYKKAINGYENFAKKHPSFTYNNPSVKSSLVSLLQSYNGVSGYINPLTGEAQVNSLIPKNGYPATTCHEIAHQIGWSAENEANFIGFLTAIYNDNKYFQYSGYRMAFRYCYAELHKRNKSTAKEFWKKLNKGIRKDFTNSHLHWKKYENPIEPYLKKGYNSYLKANNQTKGIKSYNYVVDLLISYLNKQQNNI